MASLLSLFAAILSIFASQIASQSVQLPYDVSVYQKVFSEAPWYSYCDLPYLYLYDPSYFAKFNQLANQFDIKTSNIYQFHAIIEQNMPTIPYPNEYNILYTAAAELKKEMDCRGIFYLPSSPACFNYEQYLNDPALNPALNPSLDLALNPTLAHPLLTKRSPIVVTDSNPLDGYPPTVIDPNPYDNIVPNPSTPYVTVDSNPYDNYVDPLNPSVTIDPNPYDNYVAPNPLNPYSTIDPNPYDNYLLPDYYDTYDTLSYDYLSLAYKNLYVMLDQQMPILPSSTYNNILNSVIANTPLEYQNKVDDVTTQLTTNIRYVLGMAERKLPPLY